MEKDKIKVLVMMRCRAQDYEEYRKLSEVYDFTFNEAPTEEQLAGAEIIIGEPSLRQLKLAVSLKWLQITYAGVDYYMNGGNFPRGVLFTNMSGAFGQAISEYVLSMVLMLMKKLHRYRDNQMLALWEDCGEEQSLYGKTVVIAGAGDIGCRVAALTKLFDCYNIGIRRVPRELPEHFDEMHTLAELDLILPKADVLVLALPATKETAGLINRERLRRMKKTAILVNVGRGVLVDTDALAQALEQGELGGAAVDVTAPEPLPKEHPLWKCKNALITPHITGASFGHLKQTWDNIIGLVMDNLRNYAAREPLRNPVDLETGYRRTI